MIDSLCWKRELAGSFIPCELGSPVFWPHLFSDWLDIYYAKYSTKDHKTNVEEKKKKQNSNIFTFILPKLTAAIIVDLYTAFK